MRHLFIFVIFMALAASPAFAEDELGSAVNTDDICEARPDICGASLKRTKKKRARTVNTVKKKKKTEAQSINDEAFNEFFADELDAAPVKAPKKETMAAPPPAATATPPATTRQPASMEPKAQRRRVSFSDYMNANANHPVLSIRRSQFQDAFPHVNRPATFTATSTDDAAPSPAAEGSAAKEKAPTPPTSSSDMATGN